jgi:hypothetical protein
MCWPLEYVYLCGHASETNYPCESNHNKEPKCCDSPQDCEARRTAWLAKFCHDCSDSKRQPNRLSIFDPQPVSAKERALLARNFQTYVWRLPRIINVVPLQSSRLMNLQSPTRDDLTATRRTAALSMGLRMENR